MELRRMLLAAGCISMVVIASAQEDSVRVGAGKAVEAVSKDGGFKLSEKAIKTIDVQLRSIESSTVEVPLEAIVRYGVKIGVYRQRDGMFHLVPIQIKSTTNGVSVVFSTELRSKDKVAIAGAALLRVSEMDAFGGEE